MRLFIASGIFHPDSGGPATYLYRLLPEYPTDKTQAFLVYPSRRHLAPRTRVVIDFLVGRFSAVSARLADERVWGEHETVWLT